MARRVRLDHELVAQGICATVEEAKRAVMAGLVVGESERFASPGMQVLPGTFLRLKNQHKEREGYVSRGAIKLKGALDTFGICPSGWSCLDVGCSTGGFTHYLLSCGAAYVCAVDVGTAQFDWNLRHDMRVDLREKTNIAHLSAASLPHAIDLAVCDVSFTSVARLAPYIVDLLHPQHGAVVTLVKPQFELDRTQVGSGGIVSNLSYQVDAVERVARALCAHGLTVYGLAPAAITGRRGNQEYFVYACMQHEKSLLPVDSLEEQLAKLYDIQSKHHRAL